MAHESFKSPEHALRNAFILAVAVLLSIIAYLSAASLTYRLGFPLDDAWIHQTYARNLAEYGQWAFYSGQWSGGSTAPLWSALLALGHMGLLDFYTWTYLLGGFFLWLLALTGEYTVRRFVTAYHPRLPWVGLFFAFEWHLVWATASGMETILHALIIILVLGFLLTGSSRYVLLGLLVGIGVWVRPDGITLLGPLGLVILTTQANWRSRVGVFSRVFVGFGTLFVLYLLFNFLVAGTPWPNTFYAKQAEYAILQQRPLFERILDIFVLPLVGAGVVLLPGVLWQSVQAVRARNWAFLSVLAWFAGYLLMYAWRLPVTYQHGRYIIPAMPVYFLLGICGYFSLFQSNHAPSRYRWALQTTLTTSLVLLLMLFWGLGARTYGQDVAVIESEMVNTAQWVADNLAPDALLAAHDIGALGYFAPRPLVDLAGLITPEVIPFIRDQARLDAYMRARGVVYLMTFPNWYPALTAQYTRVYVSQSGFAPLLGGENMAIYLLLR